MRSFSWWCPNCRTILHLETEEYQDDDARDVDAAPQAKDVRCLLCSHAMEDTENVTSRDKTFVVDGWPDGEWAAYRRWRAT